MIDLGGNGLDEKLLLQTNKLAWSLGETRQLTSNLARIQIDSAELVGRAVAVALLASEYPEYYSIASYDTPSSYYSDRQITGIGTVCGMAFDGVSTMIAVGQQGEISRSTNSGTTFAAISSPVAVKLGNPIHFDGRWFIPYDNGTLVSTDGGASFKSTATQHGIRATGKTIVGVNTLVHANITGVYYLAAGSSAWVKTNCPAPTYDGHLEYGGGHFVVTVGDYAYYSDDDGRSFKIGSSFPTINQNYVVNDLVSQGTNALIYSGNPKHEFFSYIHWIGFGWLRCGALRYEDWDNTNRCTLAFAATPSGAVTKKTEVTRPQWIAAPFTRNNDVIESFPRNLDGFATRRMGDGTLYAYRTAESLTSQWHANSGEKVTLPYTVNVAYKSNGATMELPRAGNVVKVRESSAAPEIAMPAITTGMMSGHKFFTRVK